MTKVKPKIKDILKFSEIENFDIKKLVSKDVLNKLEQNFGKTIVPFLGIGFDEMKKFIFFVYESPKNALEKKAIIIHSTDLTEEDLNKIIDIIGETSP